MRVMHGMLMYLPISYARQLYRDLNVVHRFIDKTHVNTHFNFYLRNITLSRFRYFIISLLLCHESISISIAVYSSRGIFKLNRVKSTVGNHLIKEHFVIRIFILANRSLHSFASLFSSNCQIDLNILKYT